MLRVSNLYARSDYRKGSEAGSREGFSAFSDVHRRKACHLMRLELRLTYPAVCRHTKRDHSEPPER